MKEIMVTIKLRKWNRNKTRVVLLLNMSMKRPLSAKKIAEYTNINLGWLRSRLSLWVKWHLVRRVRMKDRSRFVYGYLIAGEGRRFLTKAASSYGPYRIDLAMHVKVLNELITEYNKKDLREFFTRLEAARVRREAEDGSS